MGLVNIVYRRYFNGPNNLLHRIRAEIEQISPDIIERSVQSVGERQIVDGRQFQNLRQILLLTLVVSLFLFEVN
jgi:hypothetical protein